MEKGRVTGHIVNSVLVKRVKRSNILRMPEPSFTIDAYYWREIRHHIKGVQFEVDRVFYRMSRDDFDRLKIPYNYGNGEGYRVPLTAFKKIGSQPRMELEDG